jgi:hypothetical protein
MSLFSPWDQYRLSHRVGDVVKAKVLWCQIWGVHLELAEGVEGHIDIICLDIEGDYGTIQFDRRYYPVPGSTIDVVILEYNDWIQVVQLSTRPEHLTQLDKWAEFKSITYIGDKISFISMPNYWPLVRIADTRFLGAIVKGYYSRDYDSVFSKQTQLQGTIVGYDDRLLQVLLSMPTE